MLVLTMSHMPFLLTPIAWIHLVLLMCRTMLLSVSPQEIVLCVILDLSPSFFGLMAHGGQVSHTGPNCSGTSASMDITNRPQSRAEFPRKSTVTHVGSRVRSQSPRRSTPPPPPPPDTVPANDWLAYPSAQRVEASPARPQLALGIFGECLSPDISRNPDREAESPNGA